MRRIDKMSKEDIVSAYKTTAYDCNGCVIDGFGYCATVDCVNNIADWLNEEIPVVKRWQTVTSDDDFKKMYKQFDEMCSGFQYCSDCKCYCEHDSKCGGFVEFMLMEVTDD